jgi:hypothetical protein
MTTPAETFTSTTKATPITLPPQAHQRRTPTVPVVFGPSNDKGSEDVEDEVEIVYLDLKYSKGPVHVKIEPSTGKTLKPSRPPGGVAASLFASEGVLYVGGDNSPAPTQNYSPTDLGAEDMEHYEPGDGDFPWR